MISPFGWLARFRGTVRMGRAPRTGVKPAGDFHLSGEEGEEKPQWLDEARRLIPGEALAGYLSLQALTKAAQQPENVKVVLALAFLFLTIVLRWFGTQDPTAEHPSRTTQRLAVVLSAACFVALVYATGGQLFWHQAIPDQALYGQIGAFVIGSLGPLLYRVPSAAGAPAAV